jgi:hypothetical protein
MPRSILADGQSQTTIVITARGASGELAEDGTRIDLTTTLGTIPDSVTTTRGVARVQLTSANVTGTAIVSATSGGATATTAVSFTDEVAEAYDVPTYVFMSADYLAYSGDRQYADALGDVKVTCGDLAVSAPSAKLDMTSGLLFAGGGVLIVGKGVEKEALRLTLDCGTLRGEYESSPGVVTQFDGPALAEAPEGDLPDEPELGGEDLATSDLLIVARKMRWFPGQMIQFSKATIYLYGSRALSLPHYEYYMAGAEAVASQYLGVGPNGLTVSFPYFLSMDARSKSSLVLSRGRRLGWGAYGERPGWSIGLEQAYNRGARVSGEIAIDDLASEDWGAHWDDTRLWGASTYSYLSLDWPNHEDLFGSASLSRAFRGFTANLSAYTTRYSGFGSQSSYGLYLRTMPAPFLTKGTTSNVLIRADYATGSDMEAASRRGVYFETRSALAWFGARNPASLATSLGRLWSEGDEGGMSYQVSLTVRPRVWDRVPMRFDYSFRKSPGLSMDEASHRVSASMYGSSLGRFGFSLHGSYQLDRTQWSGFLNASYQVTPAWQLVYRGTRQNVSGYAFNDYEAGVSRMIGYREFRLLWSHRRGELLFELGAGGF